MGSDANTAGHGEGDDRDEQVNAIKKELVEMKTKLSYDAMAVLFRRYELAKPSSAILYDKRWLTTFVSDPVVMYKVVATTPSGKLLSIFDGETQYNLGRRLLARRGAASWPPITCCFFCYPTVHQAIAASLPAASKLRGRPRVIVKLRCEGRAYVHNNRHPTDRHSYGDDAAGARKPATVLVNDTAEYSSEDFDVWAFSDVMPMTIYKDIVSEEYDGSFTRRSSKQDRINARHAFRV